MHPAPSIVLTVLFAMAASTAMAGQCDTQESAHQAVLNFTETTATMVAQHKAREAEVRAEIEALMKKMVDSKRWTQAQSNSFFKDQRDTPESQAESKLLNKRGSGALGAGMKAGILMEQHWRKGEFILACRQVKPYREALSKFAEVNDRDLLFRLNLVKKAYAR